MYILELVQKVNELLQHVSVHVDHLKVFRNWHYVLPEDGTHVPQHVGEPYLLFALI